MYGMQQGQDHVRDMVKQGFGFVKSVWYLENVMVPVVVSQLDLFDIEFLAGKKDDLFNTTLEMVAGMSAKSGSPDEEDNKIWMSPEEIDTMRKRLNNHVSAGGRPREYIRHEYDRDGKPLTPLIRTELSVRKLAYLVQRGGQYLTIPESEVLKIYLAVQWLLEQFYIEHKDAYNQPNRAHLKIARAYDQFAEKLYEYARWDIACPQPVIEANKPKNGLAALLQGFDVNGTRRKEESRTTIPGEDELPPRESPMKPFAHYRDS